MRPDEARRALGVAPAATPAELRRAWRRLVREAHPDVAPAGTDAGGRTARINAAYTLLRAEGTAAGAPAPAAPPPPGPTAGAGRAEAGSGTIVFDGSPTATFLRLLEAAYRVGDVTHIDPDGGLLEVLVDEPGLGTCSVLVDIEGRPDGRTEASVSIEVLNDPLKVLDVALLHALLEELARGDQP